MSPRHAVPRNRARIGAPIGALVLATLLSAASGCASPDNFGHGALAAKVRGTLQASTEPPPLAPIEGRSESYSFLYLFASGDASLDAAIREGGLRRVHHVDWETKSMLFGLLSVHTTIVVGE